MMALSAPIDLNYSKLNYTAMKHFNLLKTLLLLCALIVGSLSSWADTYTWTCASGQLSTSTSSFTVNNVEWTFSPTWSDNTKKYVNWSGGSSNWYQIGSSKNVLKSLTIGTSGISGVISSVEVKWSSAGANAASLGVSVGESSFTTDNASSSSSTIQTSTFTGSSSGPLVLSFTCTTGIKLQKVTVNYSAGGNVGNTVDAPDFSLASGAVTAGTKTSLIQTSADAIRYTIDETNPTKTTGILYSSPIEITTSTTIKAIAIKDDDVSSVATATYTIKVDAPTFNPETDSEKYYLEGSTFAMSASGNKIYYNLTKDGSDPANPTTSSTEYTTPITISGTTKIKAIAVDVYGNSSSVVTRTYTGIAPATLPFSWSGTSSKGKSDLGGKTGVKLSLGSDYASSNAPYRLKFDGEGKFVTIFTDEKPYLVSFSAKLFNATTTGSKLTVQESVDGKEFSDVEEFTINGSANSTFGFTTTNSFDTNTRVVRLVLSEKDQNVGVGTIVVTKAESITISAAGWATYCSTNALDFTGVTALTAYTATMDGSAVKFNKVTGKVPANTGLLVKGETANVPVCASAEAVQNLLEGVTTDTPKDADEGC